MSLVGKSIYPLDLVENTIKKFNVSLTQNYINQVVNYFAKTQDINLTFDFYYNLLKDSKQYFIDNDIDKNKQKKLNSQWNQEHKLIYCLRHVIL